MSASGEGEARVDDVSYAITRDRDPLIDIDGRLVGDPDREQGFYIVKTGDPGTFDSTPDRNPGTRGFFPSDELDVGSGGCWSYVSQRLGYPCVGGVTFRFHFVLMPDDVAGRLATRRDARGDAGLESQDVLENDQVTHLGYVVVPTERHDDCPG